MVIGDPSYFHAAKKTRTCGRVIRSICILDHPIAGTDNAESVQIIIPALQVRDLLHFADWHNAILCALYIYYRV